VSLPPGTRVRARAADPGHHTRLPRYVRGHTGDIVACTGQWPLPDDRARGLVPPRVEAVYTVRFTAAQLWGEGDHVVTIEAWESYLEPAG
jgi:Nitrile hydratase beta subunit, C-terminal